MNKKRVDKLYSGLSPHEQAALAFGAAVRMDEKELDAIMGSVERRDYTCLHWDYIRRTAGLRNLAGTYGVEYWKSHSRIYAALLLLAYQGDTPKLRDICKRFDVDLMAMEIALADVCKLLKVDVAAVKKLAGREPQDNYQSLFDSSFDNELVQQYTELFKKAAMLD